MSVKIAMSMCECYKVGCEFNLNYEKNSLFRDYCKIFRIKPSNNYIKMKEVSDSWKKHGGDWLTRK